MDVSVIIPTFARAAKLAACLTHLAGQNFDAARFEVLVGMDGGSDQELEAARKAAHAAELRHIEVRRFERAGPGTTRNRLVEHARGNLLLLLNDDVRPEPDLIRQHVEAHRARAGRGAAMVLGAAPWVVHEQDTMFDRLIRETSMIFFYDRMDSALADGSAGAEHDWGFRHAWTLNLSLPREVVNMSGGFDARLKYPMFEDLEFAFRAGKAIAGGVPVVYRPEARVLHDHRIGVERYLKRERRLGAAAWDLAGVAPECSMAVFRKEIRSSDYLVECRMLEQRDRKQAVLVEEEMRGWERAAAATLDGPAGGSLMKEMYERHLTAKRWAWREGLLGAAAGSA